MSLFRRVIWRNYWIALLRSGKDKRARTWVLKFSFLAVYLIAYIIYLVWIVAKDGYSAVLLFAPGIAGAFLVKWMAKRDKDYAADTSIALHISKPPLHTSSTVRQYIEERALIVSALLARAGSEVYFTLNEPPTGAEIITRQKHNQLLRQNGLWEKMEADEAALMSSPDRSWTPDQQRHGLGWSEQLRLLRWTLRIDAEIMPLAHMPPLDYTLAIGLFEQTRPLGKPQILESWNLRSERDLALSYLARLVAEADSRKLIAPSPERDGWAKELRAQTLGASTDFIVGSKTVAELDDDAIRSLGVISSARQHYAAYLVELLSAAHPFSITGWTQSIQT